MGDPHQEIDDILAARLLQGRDRGVEIPSIASRTVLNFEENERDGRNAGGNELAKTAPRWTMHLQYAAGAIARVFMNRVSFRIVLHFIRA